MRCLIVGSYTRLLQQTAETLSQQGHEIQLLLQAHPNEIAPSGPHPFLRLESNDEKRQVQIQAACEQNETAFVLMDNSQATTEATHQHLTRWRQVLEAARQSGMKHVVYSSDARVYGSQILSKPQAQAVGEWIPPKPDCEIGLRHALAEQIAAFYTNQNLRITCLRYFEPGNSGPTGELKPNEPFASLAYAMSQAIERTLGKPFEAININADYPLAKTPSNPNVLGELQWLSSKVKETPETMRSRLDCTKTYHLLGIAQGTAGELDCPCLTQPVHSLPKLQQKPACEVNQAS